MALEVKTIWNGAKISQELDNAVFKALTRASNIMQTEAKLLVRKDTHNLEGSIVKAVKDNKAIISTNEEYAPAQEFGLRSKPNYGFTPYMRPALNNNKKTIKNIFEQEIKKVYK
ncbi:MAG: hypothetical protein WBA93_23575 [Microcoleaceae cyanobacterium]